MSTRYKMTESYCSEKASQTPKVPFYYAQTHQHRLNAKKNVC